MRSAWSDPDAAAAIAEYTGRFPRICDRELALRTYTSRLIGQEPALVLHGGGNTSVKTTRVDLFGEPVPVLCVKGSGWDLATIEPPGLPAVRLAPLQALRRLDALDDAAMVLAARQALVDAGAPDPSVEVLLHAFLPHRFIDHSHADAILALVDQPRARELAAEVFGESLAVVPYVMPGFALAKLAAEVYEAHPACEGLLLLQHGLFTFGDDARTSYQRHIAAVTRAEAFLAARARSCPPAQVRAPAPASALATTTAAARPAPRDLTPRWPVIAALLRGRLELAGGRPILHLRQSPAIRDFVDAPELAALALRGPATPDHVIRTKQFPLVLDLDALAPVDDEMAVGAAIDRALADYRRRYRDYFTRQTEGRGLTRVALDPDPRVILIPGLGLCGVGEGEKAAKIAADLYEHTITIIGDAEAVGAYQALGEDDLFDMEYWPLEQAKLGARAPRPLAGQVVVITGAAGGIGQACARAFAAAGAHLFLVDRDPAVHALARALGAAAAVVDVTDREAVDAAIDACVRRFGGVDGLVSNAGAAVQAPISTCPPGQLEASLAVNLLAHQWAAAAVTRVLRRQGRGGYLLFNASKAAFNPGEGFGPYAIAKAALVALMKQYALEHGRDRIRANAVNADRIRSGLLPPEVVESRARARGLDPAAYFRANLLAREVTADDVAQAFVGLALAGSTTAAVVTVDGGNIAASPR